jgi:hypothetical protein
MTNPPVTVNLLSRIASALSIFRINRDAGRRGDLLGLRAGRRRSSLSTLSPSVQRILKSKSSRLPAFLLSRSLLVLTLALIAFTPGNARAD